MTFLELAPGVSITPDHRTLNIDGVSIARELFPFFAAAASAGTLFRLLSCGADAVVSIERFAPGSVVQEPIAEVQE